MNYPTPKILTIPDITDRYDHIPQYKDCVVVSKQKSGFDFIFQNEEDGGLSPIKKAAIMAMLPVFIIIAGIIINKYQKNRRV